MTAMPVSWHEECLRNQKHHLAAKEADIRRMEAEVARLRDSVAFRERQIAAAKAAGKEKFDEEQYLRPRKSKGERAPYGQAAGRDFSVGKDGKRYYHEAPKDVS